MTDASSTPAIPVTIHRGDYRPPEWRVPDVALDFVLGKDRSGLASAGRFLLILLDLNLPDMSGIDILQKIKTNAHTKRLPVVILTTTDDEREIQRCYDLGANVYITKPVEYESFAHAIRQLGLFFSVIQIPETQ